MNMLYQPQTWQDYMELCARGQDLLLNDLLNLKYSLERNTGHALIRSLSSRLKSIPSITSKLERFGLDKTPQSAAAVLHDVIGARIICSYLSDIEKIIAGIASMPSVQILEVKDYVAHPKESGYRSVHVLVLLNVQGKYVEGEIQLRTTAMDSWAALEHSLRYKRKDDASEYVNQELLECSRLLHESDIRMEKIFRYIQQSDAGENKS